MTHLIIRSSDPLSGEELAAELETQNPFSPYKYTIITPTVIKNQFTKLQSDYVGNNYLVQQQITKYLLYKLLDRWLYQRKFSKILSYLKYENGKIFPLRSQKEVDANDTTKDSSEIIEKKADWIEDNILDEKKLREILMDVSLKYAIKWYMLPHAEEIINSEVKHYLKKKLRKFVKS